VSGSRDNSSPSSQQLRYLRVLAEQTGTSFTYPATRAQASSEIDRLVKLKAGVHRLPLDLPREQDGESLHYATAVRDDEVSDHGVSARWASASAETDAGASVSAGTRTQLDHYRISAGERVLYGQRINGRVRLTDRPADGSGRSYLVEAGLETDGFEALKTLVTHYIEQALELDRVPMSTSALRHQSEFLAEA
jgi:hypothetical protein